jgi:3-oxoacyl-[acyl-carrier-protein] synthase II
MLIYEFAGLNWKGAHVPVWQRGPHGGFALGSLGAFLVLEARDCAEQRGAAPQARLSAVLAERTKREPGAIMEALDRMWGRCEPRLQARHCAVISGATGAEPATSAEQAFLSAHPEIPVRAPATYLGHGMEPQFPMNVALAAAAVQRGALFAGGGTLAGETPFTGSLRQAIVTGVGHWRGEGMALVEAVR